MSQEHDNEKVKQALLSLDHPSHDDEHEEHVDERWLVSYADMMTLLFGLFVLLYSMATLDKKTVEQIRASTEAEFVAGGTTVAASPTPVATPEPIPDVRPELNKATKRIEELETLLAQKDSHNLKTAEDTQAMAKQIQLINSEKEKLQQAIKLANQEIQALEKERTPAATTRPPMPDVSALEKDLKNIKKDLKQAEAKALQSEKSMLDKAKEVEKLKALSDDLNEKIKSSGQGGEHQSFLAFFMNWSTKDHDVDLVIEDPEGTVFDFKHRKRIGHPGNFALDTRRGPGVELWQSDRIIPGKYKATYMFYNNYGNSESAKVSGTIFTPKGNVELPTREMDVSSNRKVQFVFAVDKDGRVKLQP